MDNEKKAGKIWVRTISPELHEAWKKLRRKKDPETMATELQYSRPVIDRALIYGYVSMPELTEKINTFFMTRLEREKKAAGALMSMADEVSQITKK